MERLSYRAEIKEIDYHFCGCGMGRLCMVLLGYGAGVSWAGYGMGRLGRRNYRAVLVIICLNFEL